MIYSYEHKEQLSAAPGETIDIPVLIRDEINQRADTPVLVINPRYNSSNLLRDNKTVIVGVSKNKMQSKLHTHIQALSGSDPKQYCSLSIIFYILCEILPTIIFFSVIIHFNITFKVG